MRITCLQSHSPPRINFPKIALGCPGYVDVKNASRRGNKGEHAAHRLAKASRMTRVLPGLHRTDVSNCRQFESRRPAAKAGAILIVQDGIDHS